ncbi:transcriptional regulator [Lactobacillus sp. PFC-70]|nr:transcriptional regulator [Lactobacillus sp. PFC-70]
MKKRTFYNPETETKEEYTEVWKTESVSVKDIKDLLVTNHYWEDREGELWLDFEDPNENFRAAFNAYRRRKGYMEPQQIKDLRKRLGLDLRRFAERLGISYSKLSQIENNKRVQTLSQEVSFRKAQQDYQRQGFLTDYSATANVEKLLTVAI